MYHHIDLRVQLLAAIAVLATSQKVETFLRFALLILSIVYTVYRLIDRFEEKRKEKLKKESEQDNLNSTDDEEHERS
jgi:hypothetical protein